MRRRRVFSQDAQPGAMRDWRRPDRLRPAVFAETVRSLVRLGWRASGDRRRFFQHNVRVGAADAERSDAGAARLARGGPIGELAVDVERAAVELDVRIDLLEVQAGGNLRVLEREHGLDESGDAGGRVEMADIGLERADCSAPLRVAEFRNTCVRARTSMGSPTRVPVPCVST